MGRSRFELWPIEEAYADLEAPHKMLLLALHRLEPGFVRYAWHVGEEAGWKEDGLFVGSNASLGRIAGGYLSYMTSHHLTLVERSYRSYAITMRGRQVADLIRKRDGPLRGPMPPLGSVVP